MSDSSSPSPKGLSGAASNSQKQQRSKMPTWLFRTILGVGAAVVLVIAYLIASVTVPLMWATSIRDQIGPKLGNSIPIGMFYGFTFSFVPVLVAWQAHRKKFNKWVRVALVVVGLLLTIPNLLTLSVVYGNSGTAANARLIWASSANWFSTWAQIFMVAGVVCAVAVIVLGRMWLSRGRKIREVRAAQKLLRDQDRAAEKEQRQASRAKPGAVRANDGIAANDGGSPATHDSPPDTPLA